MVSRVFSLSESSSLKLDISVDVYPYRIMIPIIVAFTPNYLVPAAVTLRSMLNASPVDVQYDVICLTDREPSGELLGKLALIDGGTGRLTFRFMNLEHKLKGAYVDPRYSSAANYRLVIAEELPEYKYAVYTDCDIIIRQDLSKLYRELEMGNSYIAGVIEARTEWQLEHSQHLDCDRERYINSGFLVLNLEEMRHDNLSEKFRSFLASSDYLEFPDQDAINVVCKGRLHFLPPIYNGIRTFIIPAYRELFESYYSHEAWLSVAREGNIHYTGEKPWRAYTALMEEWWHVYWQLPDLIKHEMSLSAKLELQARILSLPFVRPLIHWLQTKTQQQQR